MPDASRPDLLLLLHRFPFPPDKGDRILTWHVLRFLSERFRIHLACVTDEPTPDEHLAAVRPLCERVAIAPLGAARWLRAMQFWLAGRSLTEGAFYSRQLGLVIQDWAQSTRFHALLAVCSSMAPYLTLRELRNVPAVVHLIDVDSQKWLDYAAASHAPLAWLYRSEALRLRRLECSLPSQVHGIVLVSRPEADLYRSFCGRQEVGVVENGVDLDYFAPGVCADHLQEPASCAFVGALDYRPNVDGVCWFAAEIWPDVVRRRPEAKCYLVGRQPTAAVRRLRHRPGIVLVGQVSDVRPYLARAAVAVVPLRMARGVQNKVLEALAMGKAVLAAPPALQALAVEPGVHVTTADNPGAWVEALDRLFSDAGLRQRLGEAGRRYVEEHHRWACCLGPLVDLIERVGRQDQGSNRGMAGGAPPR